VDVNLGCAEAILEPARFFAEVRERGGDVQWSDCHRAWLVLSHDEVSAAFRETETLSSDRMGPLQRAAEGRTAAWAQVVELLSGWMNFRDPPMHTRLREPVRAAFTPRAVSALEPEVRAIVAEAIDAFPAGEVDLSRDFARAVPALVIAMLLGVERADRPRMQAWSDDLAKIVFSVAPGAAPEEPIVRAAGEFTAFFSALIAREREHPSGSLLSTIVHNSWSDLTPMELVGACTLMLFGGHETTTTTLINAIGILLERPDLRGWLREHPEADGSAVDEFMRVAGSARSMVRKVKVTHERGGQRLEQGQNVFLSIASANHDPAVFADPGTVDLERDPNPHLGFGWGLHYCLGSSLARMELQLAIRALLDRFPKLEPAGTLTPIRGNELGFGRRPLPARLNV
jgi:cytochrome P450